MLRNVSTPNVPSSVSLCESLHEVPMLPLLGEGIVLELSLGFAFILQVLSLSPRPCVLVMLALALHSSRCKLTVLGYSFHLANLTVGSPSRI